MTKPAVMVMIIALMIFETIYSQPRGFLVNLSTMEKQNTDQWKNRSIHKPINQILSFVLSIEVPGKKEKRTCQNDKHEYVIKTDCIGCQSGINIKKGERVKWKGYDRGQDATMTHSNFFFLKKMKLLPPWTNQAESRSTSQIGQLNRVVCDLLKNEWVSEWEECN